MMEEEKPSLEMVANYIQNIKELAAFFKRVDLGIPEHGRSRIINICSSALKNSFNFHKQKAFRSWIYLLQRMDSKLFGVTQLHSVFLSKLIQANFFQLALQFIEVPRLPSNNIQLKEYQGYLLNSAVVYEQFCKYSSAEQRIIIALDLNYNSLQTSIVLIAHLVVLRLGGQNCFSQDSLQKLFDKVKFSYDSPDTLIDRTSEEIRNIHQQFKILKEITEPDNNLQSIMVTYQKELASLTVLQLLKTKIKQQAIAQVRKTLKSYTCNQMVSKIKCSVVKNQDLGSLGVLKQVNNEYPLCKYDEKNQIVDFSIRNCPQQTDFIGKMIGKTAQMNRIIINHVEKEKIAEDLDRFQSYHKFFSQK